MRLIADLHIHSRYSRACSRNLSFPNLAAWAAAKGIDVLATGDFTHPRWLAEIEEKLEPAEEGLFRLKKKFVREDGDGSYVPAPAVRGGRPVRFFLSTEVACIFKKGGRTRRLHLVLFCPSLAAVRRFNDKLAVRGCNLNSDGRPILGLEAKELLKMLLDADPGAMLVPAHAWTPWFSVFGSESGFDSLEECFEELTPEIHAIETGLSSDPPMNWRLSKLDGVMLISNSDAHGFRNLGREANVFDLAAPGYQAITDVLRRRDRKKFLHTIEFFPEEGKYHVDGHRACDYFCGPAETVRLKGLCPKCGKELTRGVLGRVEALADRPDGSGPDRVVPYRRIVPLEEVIADAVGRGKGTKSVAAAWSKLISEVGPEFDVLLEAPVRRIGEVAGERIAEAVARMRAGKLIIRPGYDGVFGEVRIFGTKDGPAQGRLLL